MAINVLFKFGSQSEYDSLLTHNPFALYWCNDTQRIYKGDDLMGTGAKATELAAGLLSPEDYQLLHEMAYDLSNKVDQELELADGRSLIFNESDGGGAKVERKIDGVDYASFAGVNTDVKDGIGAQIYDIDVNANKGVKLDVTRNGIYYTKGDDSAKSPLERDIAENELATKKDIQAIGKALHYIGLTELASGETVEQALNRVVETYKASHLGYTLSEGAVAIIVEAEGAVEYIWNGTKWDQFGNEGLYETKAEAQAEHAVLSNAITGVETSLTGLINTEVAAREEAINQVSEAIDGEIERATNAESELKTYIDGKEEALDGKIEDEIERAEDAEDALSDRISALEMPVEPEYDSSLNILFLNGNSVRVYDNGSSNTAEWYGAGSSDKSANTLTFPYGASISCGGNGIDKPVSFIGAQLVMDSGNIKTIRGGGLGACAVGNVDIVVNGGTITAVTGGGQKYTSNLKGQNVVENVHIILNTNLSGQSILCAGGTDVVSVGHAVMDVNANVNWCYASGSNGGYINDVTVNLNGGTINNFLGVVRGYIASAKVTVSGANVVNMWAGADNDASDNGVIKKAVIDAIEGSITTLRKGYSGLVEGDFECSGHYNTGVIGNEEEAVEECDLVVYVDKSVAVLKEELTAEYTVGGIKYGTVFEAGTSIEHILRELFTNHIPVEETDILYGSSTEIPEDISDLTGSITKDVNVLINDGMVQNIKTGDTELIQPQYTVVACKNFLELTNWQNNATKISYMTSVHKVTYGDYNIYYKIPTCYDADIGGEDYKFEFKEAEE